MRKIVNKMKEKYQTDETPIELVIFQLQEQRDKLLQRKDINPSDKKQQDTILQLIIYELAYQ